MPVGLIGWEEAHARRLLEYMGFQVKVIPVQNANVDEGLVNSIQPGAGTEVPYGSLVTLFVSEKKPTVLVPDLSGAGKEEVRKALELLGFTVNEVEMTGSAYAEGVVDHIDQAGQSLAIGSPVTIHVSKLAVEDPGVGGDVEDPGIDQEDTLNP